MAGAATVTPAAIEIRRNHLYKPLIWKPGTSGYITGNSSYLNVVKNLLELKSAQRVLVDGNIMEYTWGGFSQAGYGVLLTPKNQTIGTTNVCPMCQVTDVTIRYTTISRVAAGFQIANALSDGGGAPLAGERYIHDITVDDINGIKYGGSGLFALVAMLNNNVPVLCDVQFDHVTAFAPQHMLVIGDLAGNSDIATFVVENSILNTGPYPVWSTGGLTNCAISDKPLAIFSTCFTPYTFTHNALVGTPSAFPATVWPAGNYFHNSGAIYQLQRRHRRQLPVAVQQSIQECRHRWKGLGRGPDRDTNRNCRRVLKVYFWRRGSCSSAPPHDAVRK